MPSLLPPAVVFDCDGTLADTESLSERAWVETLGSRGYAASSEDFRAVIGHPFPQNWAYFAARAELGPLEAFRGELRERFIELFDRELVLHEDAVTTIRELAAAGVPIAVASSSSHGHVLRVLERGGLSDHVGAVVGADDVTRHKPDPEPYLAAAAALGEAPGRCTAVEDTPVGVASAVAAGMFTVAIVRLHVPATELGAAHRVVTRLELSALTASDHVPTTPQGAP
jgi:HAD superfamily hydrolase (TIGR01509 family)